MALKSIGVNVLAPIYKHAQETLLALVTDRDGAAGSVFSRASKLNSRPAFASNSPSVTKTQADKVVRRVTKHWFGGKNNVVVFDAFSDLPRSVQEQAHDEGASDSDVKDVFHDGVILLVRESLETNTDPQVWPAAIVRLGL